MICCTNPPHLTVNLQPHRTRSTGPTIISSSARRGEEGRGGGRRGEEGHPDVAAPPPPDHLCSRASVKT